MRLYLAGIIGQGGPPGECLPSRAVLGTRHPYSLQTFAYADQMELWRPVWAQLPSEVIIDSGAYTTAHSGRPMSLRRWDAFTKTFPERYPEVRHAEFMTLDVIGDQAGTWRNFDKLRAWGAPVMPVLTTGATDYDVDRALDAGTRLAMGGMIGQGGRQKEDGPPPWAARAFRRIVDRAAGGPIARVHLLGVSRPAMLRAVPGWSCDATSWLGALRWGQGIKRFGNRRLPPYRTGPQAAAAILLEITTRIRKLQALEAEATSLWERRGITYQDDREALRWQH